MSFSIVARCPSTGWMGMAMSSEIVGIGRYCESILPDVGAAAVQGALDPSVNRLALGLLRQGLLAPQALEELLRSDPRHAGRQFALVDRQQRTAGFTGDTVRAFSGHRTGDGYAVLGEDLHGAAVLDAMARTFEERAEAALDERLMSTLVAGRDAGGSRTPEQSAAIITYGVGRPVEVFMRMDCAPDATHALRRIFDEYKLYEPMYKVRIDNPAQALSPDAIEAALQAKRSAAA